MYVQFRNSEIEVPRIQILVFVEQCTVNNCTSKKEINFDRKQHSWKFYGLIKGISKYKWKKTVNSSNASFKQYKETNYLVNKNKKSIENPKTLKSIENSFTLGTCKFFFPYIFCMFIYRWRATSIKKKLIMEA